MLWTHYKICKRISANSRTNSVLRTNVIEKVMSKTPVDDCKNRARLNYEARKSKTKTYEGGNQHFSIEVLGNGAHGSPRAVNIYTDIFRGLFNCGEGTQRLATEYKIKITRIPHVFITYPSWENISGLLGLALSSQSIGIPELYLHGPKCIENVFSATNKFVALRSLSVKTVDCENEADYEDGTIHIKSVPLYSSSHANANGLRPSTAENSKRSINDIIKGFDDPKQEEDEDDIDYYAHLGPVKRKNHSPNHSNKKSRSHSVDCSNSSKILSSSKYCVSYICQTKKTLGKLLIEKCIDLGVPYGPLLSKLKYGETITLENGTVVYGNEVKKPDLPGGIVIVLECPNESFLDSLLKEPAFYRHQSGYEDEIASAVIHFSPPSILNHAKFKEWMNRFPRTTKHVFINEGNKSLGSISIQRQQQKLNLIHSEIFPLLADSYIPEFPRVESETVPEGHSLVSVQGAKEETLKTPDSNGISVTNYDDSKENLDELYDRVYLKCNSNSYVNGETLCRLFIRPVKEYDYSRSLVLKKKFFQDEVLSLPQMDLNLKKLHEELAALKLTEEKYPKLLFLGTGSSQPNKMRNTSGILLFIDENTLILLDCGEGTYSQMVQFFGKDKARNLLKKLHAVYVSHLHADHHMGLITLLKQRHSAFTEEGQSYATGTNSFQPLFLLAPIQLTRWLNLFDKEFEKISHLYFLIPNNVLMDPVFLKNKYNECLNLLNMKEIKTAYVKHCPNAFGVALTHNDGWKLTYSGDTRPCQSLIDLGKDSDVLIHEATLDDSLRKIAEKKLHSTTSEAIEIGKRMNARFTLLTHFSQRYSHIPLFNENFTNNVGIAFDNMMVSFNQLPILPKLTPIFKTIFNQNYELMESKRDAFLLKKQRKDYIDNSINKKDKALRFFNE